MNDIETYMLLLSALDPVIAKATFYDSCSNNL